MAPSPLRVIDGGGDQPAHHAGAAALARNEEADDRPDALAGLRGRSAEIAIGFARRDRDPGRPARRPRRPAGRPGRPAPRRFIIWRLRLGPSLCFASSLVRRQTMHQQYFGAPGLSKNASKSSRLADVTGRKASTELLPGGRCNDAASPRHPKPTGAAVGSGHVLHRHDAEGVHLALVIADRHVFAGDEAMRRQAEADLVALIAVDIVAEAPRATGAMDEMADILLLARPRADDTAAFAMLLPPSASRCPSASSGAVKR